MNPYTIGALLAVLGFSTGDVLTAEVAKRISGKASMFLITSLKLILYLPFLIFWFGEFTNLSRDFLIWVLPLGLIFTVAYLAFNVALEVGTASVVGVIAGAFPAIATVVAFIFLNETPSVLTLVLVAAVLIGVAAVGLPKNFRKSTKLDKGVALALVTMLCWGIYTGFIRKLLGMVHTPHPWFVVQFIVSVIMVVSLLLYFNKKTGSIVKTNGNKRTKLFILGAAAVIGMAELMQALAFSKGQTAIVAGIIGGYPAIYAVMASRVFHEKLSLRQWGGVAIVTVAIVVLSVKG